VLGVFGLCWPMICVSKYVFNCENALAAIISGLSSSAGFVPNSVR